MLVDRPVYYVTYSSIWMYKTGKQKQPHCKKVAWPSKIATKKTDMRL